MKKLLTLFTAVMMTLMLATACGNTNPNSQPNNGGTDLSDEAGTMDGTRTMDGAY